MKIKILLLALFLLVGVFALTAYAAIPHLMNYQGKATDKAGAPLNGTYSLTFRIYNTETGGSPKWTETQHNIQIVNGIFQVQLGSITPLNLLFDEAYWISIEINADGEMLPRTRLASVPYAYKADIANNGVPTGVIMAWAADNPPVGWVLCNGDAISRTTYADLFSIIGTTYGSGDGITTFNLPDMKGRVAVGKSSEMEFMALGQKGGEKTHKLTIAEMPSHTHSGTLLDGSGGGAAYPVKAYNYSHVGYTGGDASHNNLQPYVVLNYIIKT